MAGLMGFECVIRALRSGYRLRRPHWDPDKRLFLKRDDDGQEIIIETDDPMDWGPYRARSTDLLAEDWEKYTLLPRGAKIETS